MINNLTNMEKYIYDVVFLPVEACDLNIDGHNIDLRSDSGSVYNIPV